MNSAEKFTVWMEVRKWNDFQVYKSIEIAKRTVPSNSAILMGKFNMSKIKLDKKEYFCSFFLKNEKNEIISKNFVYPSYFKGIVLNPNLNIRISIVSKSCKKNQENVKIKIEINSPAYFVYILFTHNTITRYKLSDNGFIQLEPSQEIVVIYRNPNCSQNITVNNFKIKTLNQFLI